MLGLEREIKKKTPEKKLANMLNKEIRFRRDANLRYSLTKNCYLYKQRKITNQERISNLKVLVERPDKRSTATLDDLRDVYIFREDIGDEEDTIRSEELQDFEEEPDIDDEEDEVIKDNTSPINATNGTSSNVESFVLHGPWPPHPFEHLAVKTDDSWVLGEVVNLLDDENVLLRIFKKVNMDGYEKYSLWQDDDDER